MASNFTNPSAAISLDKDSILHHVFSHRTAKLKPRVKLLSNKMTMYFDGIDYSKSTGVHVDSRKNLNHEKLGGKVSDSRRRKIRTIIDTWVSSMVFHVEHHKLKGREAKYVPVFLTLTLSGTQRHADAFVKRHMLGELIKYMKRNCGVEHYFWRAESQTNGNIHFHLLIDKYIPKEQIQLKWNSIQNSHGYLIGYYNKHGHINAPSTDIRSPKDKNELIAYLLKYMSKDEKNRLIEGRIWGMSDSLRNIDALDIPLDNSTKPVFLAVYYNDRNVVKYDDFFISVTIPKGCNYNGLAEQLQTPYRSHLIDVYNYLYLGYLPTWRKSEKENLDEWIDFETGEIIKLFEPEKLNFQQCELF